MPSLSRELNRRCKALLKHCREFDTNDDLKTVFVIDGLADYRERLPDNARDKDQRIRLTINFLLPLETSDGESVFLLFLRALLDNYECYKERDGFYSELQQLMIDVERKLHSVDPETKKVARKKKTPREKDVIGGQKRLTQQQVRVCLTVNKYHNEVKGFQKDVRKAVRFFGKSNSQIYPSQCALMLGTSLPLNRSVDKFRKLLNTVQLPAHVQGLHFPVVQNLNEIDVALTELMVIKKEFCHRIHEVPEQYQQIQQKLKKIDNGLSRINTLLDTFNTTIGPLEQVQALSSDVDLDTTGTSAENLKLVSGAILSESQSVASEGA